jgi:hypothetical protein
VQRGFYEHASFKMYIIHPYDIRELRRPVQRGFAAPGHQRYKILWNLKNILLSPTNHKKKEIC